MFKKPLEERLSDWFQLRLELDQNDNPYIKNIEFWNQAPMVPYNHNVDQYNVKSWPTPWEIIANNRYDDFTLALMLGYSLKLTNKFSNSLIEVRTLVDYPKTRLYNLVYINENDVLNYDKNTVVKAQDIDQELYLENKIEVSYPR
jgi:hypothetical protein